MEQIDNIFEAKTREAINVLAQKESKRDTTSKNEVLPFEVNKVLNQISQETKRRAKVLKRKPISLLEQQPEQNDGSNSGQDVQNPLQ